MSCYSAYAENSKSTEKFCYQYDPHIFTDVKSNVSKKDIKYFGPKVAQLIALLNEACVQYGTSESEYKPRLVKPLLYNTLIKTISFYKKEIRKGNISKEEATATLTELLQKGYVCVFEDTTQLEEQLASANTPEKIMEIMGNVSIVAY